MEEQRSTSSRHYEFVINTHIGQQDAIRMLPKSFDSKNIETLEILDSSTNHQV